MFAYTYVKKRGACAPLQFLYVNNFSNLFNTEETKEGLSAFVEKRNPNFRK